MKPKPLNHPFQIRKPVSKSVEQSSRNRELNMTQTERVYAICRRLEVDDDVIFGGNVKTIESYVVGKFDVAGVSNFLNFPKKITAESVIAAVA